MRSDTLLRGVRLLHRFEADIYKVPDDATSDAERELVVSEVPITDITEYTRKDEERGKMATVATDHVCYTIYSSNQSGIREDMILSLDGTEFRIRKVTQLPTINPVSLMLYLEEQA